MKSRRCLGCVAAEAERQQFPEDRTGYQTYFTETEGEEPDG